MLTKKLANLFLIQNIKRKFFKVQAVSHITIMNMKTRQKWKFILYMLCCILLLSNCNYNSNQEQLELKRKELLLKERELELREQELKLHSQTNPNEKETLSSIYETVKKGVYLIYTESEDGYSQGSAFVVDKNGLAISNYHVFESASSAIAINEYGDEFMITEIIEYDEENDFIIFRLGNQDNIPFLTISNKFPIIGENCFAVGNPKGLTQTLSTGIISGFRNDKNLIQTTTSITHGSSGGPLFNENGQVIGVTSSGLGEANLNFAININLIPVGKYKNKNFNVKTTPNSSLNIRAYVENYFQVIYDERWDELLALYANNLNRFYGKFNISNLEAVAEAKKYKPNHRISDVKFDVRWESVSSFSSSAGTEIKFTMDYQIVREDKNKASNFVLDIVMFINSENKISSIYENILMKR